MINFDCLALVLNYFVKRITSQTGSWITRSATVRQPDKVCVCTRPPTLTRCVKVYKVCKCPLDMLSKFNTPLYTLTTMPTFNTWTASAKCSGSAGLFWGEQGEGGVGCRARTHTCTHKRVRVMEELTRDLVAWHLAHQHSASSLPLSSEVSFPLPDKRRGRKTPGAPNPLKQINK